MRRRRFFPLLSSLQKDITLPRDHGTHGFSRPTLTSLGVTMLVTIALLSLSCSTLEPTATPQPTSASVPLAATLIPSTESPDPKASSELEATVKIGTLFPQSDARSEVGKERQSAISFAFDLVNEAGGVNGKHIEALHRDSGGTSDVAISAAIALVADDGVTAIIGAASSVVTIAVAEAVSIPRGVLQISPASNSSLITHLDDNDLVFRTTPSDIVWGQVSAELARELGWARVATTYVDDAFGVNTSANFSEHFESLGGEITSKVAHDILQTSYGVELLEASSGDPSALVFVAYPETSRELLLEAAVSGYFDEYLFFLTSGYNLENVDALRNGAFDGSYGTRPGTELTSDRAWFFDKFATLKGGNIEIAEVSESFDTGLMLALAIEKADSEEPSAIRDALRQIANPPGIIVGPQDIAGAFELVRNGDDVDYVGASGRLDFDAHGDIGGTVEIWRITDGELRSTDIFVSPGSPIDLSKVR